MEKKRGGNPNWEKGKSGNPKGRPVGCKDRYTRIRDAFFKEFEERGVEGLKAFAKADPTSFYKLVAGLLPKDLNVEAQGQIVLKWLNE